MDAWQRLVLVSCAIVLALEGCALCWRRTTTTTTDDENTIAMTGAMQQQKHRSLLQNQTASKTTIINVGLPRTGSEFLYDYFVCQGILAWHRTCCDDATTTACRRRTCGECMARNLQSRQSPPWNNCGDTHHQQQSTVQAFLQIDVETAAPYSWFLPQHGALESFFAEDENVLWILTLRSNATLWAESVLHWHSITQRLMTALNIQEPPAATLELPRPVTYDQVVQSLEQSVDRVQDDMFWKAARNRLVQAYERHVQHVRTTATTHGVSLVEIILDDDHEEWQGALQAKGIPLQSTTTTSSCWKGYNGRYETDWQDFSFSL